MFAHQKNPAEGVTGDKNSCISNNQKKKIPANWKSPTPNHFTKNSVKKAYMYQYLWVNEPVLNRSQRLALTWIISPYRWGSRYKAR